MSQFKPLVTTLVYLPDMKTVFEVHKGNLGKKVMYSYTFGTKKILKEYFKEGYKHVIILLGNLKLKATQHQPKSMH